LITANCCEETELKWDKYCWTSLLEPILLKSCTTVDRVEKLFEEGEAYSRRVVRATEAAALGKVQAEAAVRRLEAMHALLATAPAVDRRASILRIVWEWSCFVRRKARLPAPAEQRSNIRRSQAGRYRLFHEKGGG
jgi:hypothetical protein